MFDVREAAQILECSVKALYYRVKVGKGPTPTRRNGRLYFSSAALLPFAVSKDEKWTRKRVAKSKRGRPKKGSKREKRAAQKKDAARLYKQLKQGITETKC